MPKALERAPVFKKSPLMERIGRISYKAMRHAEGLYKQPGEPGYNPDAAVPWSEASTKTRFAVEVYKQLCADGRENTRSVTALGVVALQSKLGAAQWEKMAQAIDAEAAPVEVPAIDAVTEESK